MNGNELETIVLNQLERLATEAAEARREQDRRIGTMAERLNEFERHLTRLSGLYRHLEKFIENLNNALGGRSGR